MNNKLTQQITSDLKRIVELTPAGPVLLRRSIATAISSIDVLETFEVDEAPWDELQELLKTGQLDNAKVKEVIRAHQ